MKKNYLKHILLCLCLFAGSNAFAYDAEIDGIYYNFSGDEATVTYQSQKGDYSGSVVIPESVTYGGKTYSVTSIGNIAFSGCTGLTSVTIPNSVTSIGGYAFSGCTGLTSITIPNSVTSIGNSAFDGCTGLTSITIPNSVTSIEYYAFYGCTGLTSVTIPNSVTIIGSSAFSGCKSLTSVTIPNSVTSIGYYAFDGCTGLTSITIPESVTSIGSGAFRFCFFLKDAFVNNSALTSDDNWGATLADLETSDGLLINDNSIVKCRPWATSVTIPNSVTSIGYDAFNGCTGLTSITIPNSVTSIGSSAFYDCTGLTAVHITDLAAWCNIGFLGFGSNPLSFAHHLYLNSREITDLVIPNGVTSIGNIAFSGCTGLTSVTIPSSVTDIGSNAFASCKLRNVLVKCTTPPTNSGNEIFSTATYNHTVLYVPTGSWDAYAYDDSWCNFINIRETAMTEEEVSAEQAYTLMDAETFAYSVYDPVNDCIGTINSIGAIDENNPNHSWQMIEADGVRYLYNIGAKKFAKRNGNSFDLSDTPESIEVENGDNGMILGAQPAQQWALVSNDRLSVEQAIITGVDDLSPAQQEGRVVYDLMGRRLNTPQKGINIIDNRKVLKK